jgi:hypothetical protein
LLADVLRAMVANAPKNNWEIIHYCSMVVRGLVRLPEQERPAYLWPILDRLETSGFQPGALGVLIPYLPDECLERALGIASIVIDDASRADLLVALAIRLPPAERTECLTQVLLALGTTTPERRGSSAATLKLLIPMLSGDPPLPIELLSIAVELAMSLGLAEDCLKVVQDQQRAQVVASVIERGYRTDGLLADILSIGPELFETLVIASQRLRDAERRATILGALAQRLPDERRKSLMESALRSANAIRDDAARARTLAMLASDLPSGQAVDALQEALRTSRTIGDDIHQYNALAALLQFLPVASGSQLASLAISRLPLMRLVQARCALLRAVSHVLDQAQWCLLTSNEVASANAIESDSERSMAWCALAPLLSDDQLTVVWKSANSLVGGQDRLRAVTGLIDHISEPLIEALWQETRHVPSDIRDELSVVLASRIPRGRLSEFAEALSSMTDWRTHAQALLALAKRMDGADREKAVRQALELSRRSGDTVTLAHSLIATIEAGDHQPAQAAQVRAALDAVLSIPSSQEADRIAALRDLVPQLPPRLLPLAIREASLGASVYRHATIVAAFRSKLSEEESEELIAEIGLSLTPSVHIELISELGPDLPAGLRVEAFKILQQWSEDARRTTALARLLPYVADAHKDSSLALLSKCAGRLNRNVVLEALPSYLPLIIASEGPEGVMRIGRSLLEVGQYFN